MDSVFEPPEPQGQTLPTLVDFQSSVGIGETLSAVVDICYDRCKLTMLESSFQHLLNKKDFGGVLPINQHSGTQDDSVIASIPDSSIAGKSDKNTVGQCQKKV